MGLSYKDTVLADGPILFWRLDEAAGAIGTQISDSSGFGLTGTIRFGATTPTGSILFNEFYGATPVSGAMFANAAAPRILMTGSMFGVSGSTTDISTSSSFTVEWWEKNLSFASFNNHIGFMNFNANGGAWGWFLAHHDVNGGTHIGIHNADRFTPTDINSGRTGAVYHCVFTYDAVQGIGTYYRNGIKLAEKPMLPPASNWSTAIGSPDGVGTLSNGSAFGIGEGTNYNGTFDCVAVYNKLLTPNRVTAHYLSGTVNTMFSTYASMAIQDNPTLYYRLNDPSGSIKDFSQVGNLGGTFIGGTAGIQFQTPGLINPDAGDGNGSAPLSGTGLSGTTAGNAPYINTATSTGIGGSGGPFSVMWWQKITAFPTGSAVNNTIGGGFGTFFAGCSGSTGEGFCGIAAADGFGPKDLPRGFFQTGQIAHYCFTYDGSNIGYIFKNGKLVLWKRMQPAAVWGANGFKIGSGSWSGEYDDVIILNQIVPIDTPLRHYLMGLGSASLPTPTVNSVQAFSGSIYSGSQVLNSGGSYIVISGSNFQPLVRVYVSGVAVQNLPGAYGGLTPANVLGTDAGIRQSTPDVIVGLSGSQLYVYAPTGTLGSASISILNPDGQSATGSNLLQYVTASDDYHAVIIKDQPNLYWRVDEGSGTLAAPPYVTPDASTVLQWKLDTTGGPPFSSSVGSLLPMLPVGYTANQWNQPLGVSSSLFAPYSGSAAFPGPSSSPYFLQTGPTGSSIGEVTTNLTIQCWVYLNDYGYGNWQQFFGKNYRPDGTWTAPFVSIGMALIGAGGGFGAGQVKANLAIGGSLITYNFNVQMPLKRWVHLAMTYDGSNVRLYMNGALQSTTGQAGAVDYGTHGSWTIGGDNSNPPSSSFETINGYVADARMENVVRSGGYLGGFAITGSAPIINDYSNHGNTGTVNLPNPYLIFQQASLIRSKGDFSLANIQSSAPTPFVSNTGDSSGQAAPPSCGIGTGSFSNSINSFSVEWWYRLHTGLSFAGIGTHRFGFANNQFLYNVTTNGGNITVGTDAGNQLSINNFVDPNPSNPPKAHHYCFTFSDAGNGTGTGIIYRDGVNIGSSTTMKTPIGWQAFEAIGPFSGSFDEVAVYPYTLSAQQVATHYSTGVNPYTYSDEIFVQLSNSAGLPIPGGMSNQLASGSTNPFQNTGSVAAFPSPGYMFDNMWPFFSPVAEGAPGFFQSQALFDFTTWTQAIQGAGFLDTQHNLQYLWPFNAGTGSGGGGGGGSTPPAPTIQNFVPGIGLPISSGTQISFDIVSSTGFVPYFAIIASFGGVPAQDLVYNSVAFNSMYSNSHNTVTAISGGFHITLLRDGGWLDGSVTITPVAFSTGSENT